LRVLNPWPELESFVSRAVSSWYATGNDAQSGGQEGVIPCSRQLPWAVWLIHFIRQHRAVHGQVSIPTTDEVKRLIRQARDAHCATCKSPYHDDFDEATRHCALAMRQIRETLGDEAGGVVSIYESRECRILDGNVSGNNSSSHTSTSTEHSIGTGSERNFWILASALVRFRDGNPSTPLPLRSLIPDMQSDPQLYAELVRIYRDQARKEALQVESYVREIEQMISQPEGARIPFADIERACRNASQMGVLRGSLIRMPHPLAVDGDGDEKTEALAREAALEFGKSREPKQRYRRAFGICLTARLHSFL